ncbi:MAG: hypothetical protein GY827_04410 [Cytophagales bacterium]|nr:hypothetical protein [Cytophagales bacterium]
MEVTEHIPTTEEMFANFIAEQQQDIKSKEIDYEGKGTTIESVGLRFSLLEEVTFNNSINRQIQEINNENVQIGYKGVCIGGIGLGLPFAEDLTFNKNTWYSWRKFKSYSQRFNGNGYTGGKIKVAKPISKSIGYAGKVIGMYNYYDINKNFKTESNYVLVRENSVNTVSTFGGTYGAAFGLGWEIGKSIVQIPTYQKYKYKVIQKILEE